MVSGGGELQREVEEGRCWGGVYGVRGGLGADLSAERERGDGQHGRVVGSTGTSPLMVARMLGDKAQAARARGRDEDGPAQQRVARRLGVHGQQGRSGIASSSGCGGRGVTWAARCEHACTASNEGSGESCAGPRVRARSGLQLEQAARACLREGDAVLSARAGSSNASASSKARQHRGEKERGSQCQEKKRKEKRKKRREKRVWKKVRREK
jgi:hypothetical protein